MLLRANSKTLNDVLRFAEIIQDQNYDLFCLFFRLQKWKFDRNEKVLRAKEGRPWRAKEGPFKVVLEAQGRLSSLGGPQGPKKVASMDKEVVFQVVHKGRGKLFEVLLENQGKLLRGRPWRSRGQSR